MKYKTHSFRNADRLLTLTDDWPLILAAFKSLTVRRIEQAQQGAIKKSKGAQRAVNSVFRDLFRQKAGWTHEAPLFPAQPGATRDERKIDFVSPTGVLGVEIALNNRSYLPGTVMRLNLAAEGQAVMPQHAVAGGVIVVPTKLLHSWGSMDSTVPDFDIAVRWIELMQHSFAIPVMLFGLGLQSDIPKVHSKYFG